MVFHRLASAALVLSLLVAPPCAAQGAGLEEIVVTGARLQDYDAASTPSVVLRKRADNLITRVTVTCDTRDLSQRKAELKATLRNLIKAASEDKRIALGVGDEVVGGFDESQLDNVISPDARADTSKATLIFKTALATADTFDAATGRIKAFAARTAKVGRTEVLFTGGWELTLISPNQYRPDVIKLVAEDARNTAAVFGDAYAVDVQGLQLPVSWYQAGALDLAIYIPYKLTVRPKS